MLNEIEKKSKLIPLLDWLRKINKNGSECMSFSLSLFIYSVFLLNKKSYRKANINAYLWALISFVSWW